MAIGLQGGQAFTFAGLVTDVQNNLGRLAVGQIGMRDQGHLDGNDAHATEGMVSGHS